VDRKRRERPAPYAARGLEGPPLQEGEKNAIQENGAPGPRILLLPCSGNILYFALKRATMSGRKPLFCWRRLECTRGPAMVGESLVDLEAFRTRQPARRILEIHAETPDHSRSAVTTPTGANKKVGLRPLMVRPASRAKIEYIPAARQKQDTGPRERHSPEWRSFSPSL